jgi:hypothetical protein
VTREVPESFPAKRERGEESGMGTERLRPLVFLEWDGSGSEENIS